MRLKALSNLIAHLSLGTTWHVTQHATSIKQHASVSQGRIYSDNFTGYHTETEAADQTFPLTRSQYTDTGPTSPSTDPITPDAWQGSHLECQFLRQWYDSTPEKSLRKRDSNPGPSALEADVLTTRPTRRSKLKILVPLAKISLSSACMKLSPDGTMSVYCDWLRSKF